MAVDGKWSSGDCDAHSKNVLFRCLGQVDPQEIKKCVRSLSGSTGKYRNDFQVIF